jgi:hypothetical protein
MLSIACSWSERRSARFTNRLLFLSLEWLTLLTSDCYTFGRSGRSLPRMPAVVLPSEPEAVKEGGSAGKVIRLRSFL